jgi:hypothetical protein
MLQQHCDAAARVNHCIGGIPFSQFVLPKARVHQSSIQVTIWIIIAT